MAFVQNDWRFWATDPVSAEDFHHYTKSGQLFACDLYFWSGAFQGPTTERVTELQCTGGGGFRVLSS